MQLSKRLSAVADMVTSGNRVADVGTDHGYIPIYLVENSIIPKAIAMDINKGPLERAKEHIKEAQMESYIELRRSDGVSALKEGEADTLIIAGMGGGLVIKILSEGKKVLGSLKEYIVQPQSEVDSVRKFMQEKGYLIIEEKIILEEGKYYPIIRAIRGCMTYEKDCFFSYGKLLLESKDPVLKKYLDKEANTYRKIRENLLEYGNDTKHIEKRQREVDKELALIQEAREYFV